MAGNTNALSSFALGAGANVMSATAYAALATRSTGYEAGIALSQQLNTTWRQSAFVAMMIAQFTADWGNANVVDDGNIPAFEANFEAALVAWVVRNIIFPTSGPSFSLLQDTGTANNMVASLPVTPTLAAGLKFEIQPAAANSPGNVVINLNGLGNKNIVYPDGASLAGFDYTTSSILTLEYTPAGNFCVTGGLDWVGLAQNGAWLSGDDSGTATALVVNLAPALTAYRKYQGFRVKLANTIGAGATININSLGPKAIVYQDGSATVATDYSAGAILFLVYDGTNMQIASQKASTGGIPVANTTTRGIARQATLTEMQNNATSGSVPAFVTPEGLGLGGAFTTLGIGAALLGMLQSGASSDGVVGGSVTISAFGLSSGGLGLLHNMLIAQVGGQQYTMGDIRWNTGTVAPAGTWEAIQSWGYTSGGSPNLMSNVVLVRVA